MKKLLALLLCLILCLSLFACNASEEPTETEAPTETDGNQNFIFPQGLFELNIKNSKKFSITVNDLEDDNVFRIVDQSAAIEKLLELGSIKMQIVNTETIEGDVLNYANAKFPEYKWVVRVSEYIEGESLPTDQFRPSICRGYIYCNDSTVLLVDGDNKTSTVYKIIDEHYDLDKFLEQEYKKLPVKINVTVENGALVLPDMTPKRISFSAFAGSNITYEKDLDGIYAILKGFRGMTSIKPPPILEYMGGSVVKWMTVHFENNAYITVRIHTIENAILLSDALYGDWYSVEDTEQMQKLQNIAEGIATQ